MPYESHLGVVPRTHASATTSNNQEQVITLATAHDRQRLRAELLRVILRSESRRTGRRLDRPTQDLSPTEGPAKPPSQVLLR